MSGIMLAEEMSKQVEVLEVNKCISSRLWYTSLNVFQANYGDCLKEPDHNCVDVTELEAIVESLIHSPNEEQYQWIAYILLWKLVSKSPDVECDIYRNIQTQLDCIQMKNAVELCGDVPDCTYKELLMFLQDINMKHDTKISPQALAFLKKNIHVHTETVCWIINKLISILPVTLHDITSELQDIYFSTMKLCLEHIPIRQNWYSRHEALESCSLEIGPIIHNEYLKTLMCLLSKMNINVDTEIQFLATIYPTLSKVRNIKDIELALYSRKSKELHDKWISLWDESHVCSESIINLDTAYKISKNIFNLTKNSKVHLCKEGLLKRISIRKLHWLNDILDICYVLTVNKKYSEVELLLSCDLLKRLYPVLLLKILNDCPHEVISSLENCDNGIFVCKSIRFLLEKCYSDLCDDYDLNELYTLLKRHIRIVEYILHWKRKYFIKTKSESKELKNTQSNAFEQISVKEILSLLQERNILSVLKLTIDIHNQDYDAMQDLLIESENELKIFQAYCSIVSALKAILLSDSYDTEHEHITKYFTDMMAHLSSLFPLSLRIETMENIFSLLFLRYEDFNITNITPKDDNCSSIPVERTSIIKSIEHEKSGFMLNKYAIRDMLYYLWESILVAKQEIDQLEEDKEIRHIRERISIFTSALTDARWRLKFYMKSNFIENVGLPQNESHDFSATNKIELVVSQKLTFPHRTKGNTFFYKEGSTSDETKIKSESSSETGLLNGGAKRRKRSKNVTATSDTLSTKGRLSLINLMLASKESLVLHCLWRDDLQKAQDVIEMSHMENTQLDSEAQFSKAFHTFKQDTLKYTAASDAIDSPKENLKISMLENIRLVAQEGVQSSRYTNQLETFLASQKPNLRMLNTDILSNDEMLTLTALDLSLTIGQTYQISYNLCDVAMKYLKLCRTFDSTEHASFFLKVYQLFHENKGDMHVTAILCDVGVPLSLKEWKESNAFWSDFENNYRILSDTERGKKTESRKQLCDNNHLLGLKTIQKMSAIYSSDQKYLQNIFSHLQHIHTIVPDEDNDADVRTVTDLLKTPLHHYFGYQIFDLQTEPNKLEIIASKLRVNLVYSILVNACPNVSCRNESSYILDIWDSGCVVLNQNRVGWIARDHTVKGPNQCVSEILAELLQVLRDVSSGQSHLNILRLKNISNHVDLQAVLSKTSSLATLDLSELSVGDETLTFFLNVWNIMFLHACLTVWCNDPPFDHLRHTVSLMSVGYIVGDLGLVTLASLRSRLLGNLANDLKFLTRVEELNELAWQDLELVQNPKVAFAMASEFYGTPEIRVYEAQTLNESLNNAMHDYISHYSSKSLDKSYANHSTGLQTVLPDLLRQYRNALSQNANDSANASGDNPNEFEVSKDANVEYIAPRYAYEVVLRYFEHSIPDVRIASAAETSSWQTRKLRSNLLQYLENHCWLLSYLLQRMHNENPTILENSCDNTKRTACLENLLSSPWVDKLKPLFNGNQTLTAIHDSIPVNELWSYFDHMGDDCENSLEILNALADKVAKSNVELLRFKDLILSHLLSNLGVFSTAKVLQYLYQIGDIRVLAQTILHNVNKWPMNVCEHALFHALQHEHSYKLPAHCKHRMNGILCRITIFHKMIPYCVSKSNSTWYDVVYCTEKIDPFQIIKSLISADQYELCLEWLECQAFSLEIQPSLIQDFLIGLLKNEQRNFSQAHKFLQALPSSQSVKVCKGVLKKLEVTSALDFVTNYLLEHCKTTEETKYHKALVGVDILKMLENKDRPLYVHLIKEPLLMLEQLLMNCKFESIQKILTVLHENLQQPDVNIDDFDKIVRFYAKKSLDFRVSLQRDGVENKFKNVAQSSLEAENEFVMPVNVPSKEEWVPNDKARECSCCEAVIFSMFNRRHHCRRCGRVVCAVCSQHRMQVAGYPASVLVRVCDDCKRQTILQIRAAQDAPSTTSSEAFDYWRLTRDEKHNHTIREEFSFEYAPNISLCLAILNLHSDHKMYTSFLLDRCDEMKQLLQPVNGGRINPEVDHAVIIKMIRSLLVAAKVRCAKLGFNTGLAHCDRFLSQVDLIATLVQSDCLALIPTDDLNEHTLRKLRDLLTEKEQWTLALDVSTKAGLDTQGVWAAWGKSCLKVGYFDQAREKFYHCLDKIIHEDLDDWVMLTYPKEQTEKDKKETIESTFSERNKELDGDEKTSESNHLKKSEFSKCRPLKDPPLLTEILQILDNLSVHRCGTQSLQPKLDAAQEILQTLNSLKAISQNQFSIKHLTAANQTIYYQECLYYLLMYGSYSSILQFFLKHKEFDKCLTYVLENDLERDLFLHGIYLHCLKKGYTEQLHDAMKIKDSTLFAWRKYLIYVCHFMERKQYWDILYQIQLFMRDCIRASMTCIRFYTNEANTYLDLHNRAHLLQDAQRHLESELQIESLNKRKKSVCSIHNGQGILAMEMEPSEIDRHINTICRQTEIAKFLANCEREERATVEFLNLFPDVDTDYSQTLQLPTLFGDQRQKTHLAVLAILCGRDIEEGFGIAFRIMQDYNLPQQKVYSLAGHVLALKNNVFAIEQLIKCCRSSGAPNAHIISDHVLTHCVKLLLNRSYNEQNLTLNNHIDTLVRLIMDTELRINAYIESKQLKAAYLLAVKHSRAQDIRRILKESDRLGQSAIKAICLKWLQQEPKE